MSTTYNNPQHVLQRRAMVGGSSATHSSINEWVFCEYESVSNEFRILEKTHNLFRDRMRKRFGLEHWYDILKG